ncbi:hypothetical protein QA596_01770 [Balneolales bacterium ANBcel1]|nr:hypothetical protein [Balneolales bacterium ANBcel1]
MDRKFAVGVHAGTAGIGLDASGTVIRNLNARVNVSMFSYSTNGTYEDDEPNLDYSVDGSTASGSLVFDYFPTGRIFKLSAGLYYMDFSVDGFATPNEAYELNNKVFQPERMGSLAAKVDYGSKIMPYAGLGFGNPLSPGSRLTFNFDLGVLYAGSPRFRMEGEGLISATARQDRNIQNGLSAFNFYPILRTGFTYRIN